MSDRKSVLIVGGSGFVGTHLALRLRDEYQVFATYHTRPMDLPGVTYLPMNVIKRDWIRRVVYAAQPEAVIYAAGSNSVAAAEADARNADIQHTNGAGTVSTVSEIFQPRFIYLSNAYVFDGTKGNYKESDIVLPPNTFGKAKLGGENYIRSKALNYNVIRCSPLLGRGNGRSLSLLDQLRMSLSRRERISLPDDELHSFAPIEGLLDLVQLILGGGPRNRVFHYSGLTKMTHAELGRLFARRFGFDPGLVTAAQSSRAGEVADFSLNSTATVQTLQVQPLFVEQGLDLIDQKLVSGL